MMTVGTNSGCAACNPYPALSCALHRHVHCAVTCHRAAAALYMPSPPPSPCHPCHPCHPCAIAGLTAGHCCYMPLLPPFMAHAMPLAPMLPLSVTQHLAMTTSPVLSAMPPSACLPAAPPPLPLDHGPQATTSLFRGLHACATHSPCPSGHTLPSHASRPRPHLSHRPMCHPSAPPVSWPHPWPHPWPCPTSWPPSHAPLPPGPHPRPCPMSQPLSHVPLPPGPHPQPCNAIM